MSSSGTCRSFASSFAAAGALLAAVAASAAEPLPSLGAQREITVSGVSSGGFMAVQLHVAQSRRVKAAAVVAGGPYYCAHGSLWSAYFNCLRPGAWTPLPPLSLLAGEVRARERDGTIDPSEGLRGARAWILHGSADRTVAREVVEHLAAFYRAFGVQPFLKADLPAGHGMVTGREGGACAQTAPPFLNACGFDAAGELLVHLLGPLAPRAAQAPGALLRFPQREFAAPDGGDSLEESGYAYVPESCRKEAGCRVHVALHGCRQGAGEVGEAFVRGAGYNEWAQANRIVVLYPQVGARTAGPFNPRGCWDWWGYTGPGYHTRSAPQARAIMGMADRLASTARDR